MPLEALLASLITAKWIIFAASPLDSPGASGKVSKSLKKRGDGMEGSDAQFCSRTCTIHYLKILPLGYKLGTMMYLYSRHPRSVFFPPPVL